MIKKEILEKIENSKNEIKNSFYEWWFSKEIFVEKIKKVLEWEPYDIQVIANLYYVDWCTIEEISTIVEKSENLILSYFDFILFKIKLVLNNTLDDSAYSVSNFWKNKSDKSLWEDIDYTSSMLDIKI